MRNAILIIASVLVLAGCGGKSDNVKPIPPKQKDPVATTLTTPVQNSVCTTGTVINDTQSIVAFTWNSSSNTDNYDLTVVNLLTAKSTTQNFTANQASLTLLRNTPYSWYVVSKSGTSTVTAQSATWKFYNAGKGAVSYAPFPAAITSPAFAQAVTASSGTINLTWTGSTVATGTTLSYDVYFGTTNTPPVLKSNVADSFLNSVTVISKTTYYWKIITKDTSGNTSDSGLFQFSVN
jgi:hypothetical protein